MVRINLISRDKKKEARSGPIEFAPTEMTKQLGFAALFLVTMAICAFFWFDINNRKSTLETEITEATRQRDRLKSIKELVDRLQAEKDKLDQRLQILSDLKNNLRTPMHALFFVYLVQQENQTVLIEEISQNRDDLNAFTINGIATQESLNEFSEGLMKEPFVRSIDINSQVGERFQIVVRFNGIRGFGTVQEEPEDDEGA